MMAVLGWRMVFIVKEEAARWSVVMCVSSRVPSLQVGGQSAVAEGGEISER